MIRVKDMWCVMRGDPSEFAVIMTNGFDNKRSNTYKTTQNPPSKIENKPTFLPLAKKFKPLKTLKLLLRLCKFFCCRTIPGFDIFPAETQTRKPIKKW